MNEKAWGSAEVGDLPEIRVSVSGQRLEVIRAGHCLATFPVSTSQFGLGFAEGSFQTPTGRFRVAEKIGADAAAGTIFRGRVPTGEFSGGGGEEDLVLTRILWLEGLDPENANTKDRFIYIHGTNQEDRIGEPASHGCVRMRNRDVAALFDLVPEGTPVTIVA